MVTKQAPHLAKHLGCYGFGKYFLSLVNYNERKGKKKGK